MHAAQNPAYRFARHFSAFGISDLFLKLIHKKTKDERER